MSNKELGNNALEENYKKLTQKLQLVYSSIKSKNDFDNLDMQKEEFIKLFCKAFDWSAPYDEEDEEGLEFVHENDELDRDTEKLMIMEEPISEKQHIKNQKNTGPEKVLPQENKDKRIQSSSPEEQQSKTLAAMVTDDVHYEDSNDAMKTTNHEWNTSAIKELEMNQRNDNNGTKKNQPSKHTTLPPTVNKIDGMDNKFLAESETNPSVQTGGALNQNTDSNDNVATVKRNDTVAIENNEANNSLPSFAGNASEMVQLLVGNASVARQLGVPMKGQISNRSWSSDSSSNSSTQDPHLHHPKDESSNPSAGGTSKSSFTATTNAGKLDSASLNKNGMATQFGAAIIETHVVRQVLRQLILLLLENHPNGIYEGELQAKYQQMTGAKSKIDDNIKYLLFNHRNVLVTPCINRGNLLTLNHQSIQSVLEEYTIEELSKPVSEHINAIIKLFPCGALSDVLDEMLSNFYGYRLSQIVPDMEKFVQSQCDVTSHTNESSLIYFPFRDRDMKSNGPSSQVLSTAIGFRELLIALLAHHESPINIDELEREFVELFNMRLNAGSPVINRILKKINDPTLNQEQKQSQLHHASQTMEEFNSSRSSLRSSYSSLKSMITKFRLAANFELHYEKNRALFELFCPKCQQDTAVIKSPFKEDHRTVFMGGFAHGTSAKELEEALKEYGAKMIDCKDICFRNYGWSFVKVETSQQAEALIARSPIQIRGRNIDVRPFIDRKRVKNHQQNRPSPKKLLDAVLEAVQQTPSGLTVAQMQTNLFHKFQFRVDGPEITKLVSKNAKLLQIKRHPIERIVVTPKMHRLKIEELKWKILKIWNSTDPHDGSEDNNSTSQSDEKVKEQKILSLADFENEFARRYKAYLDPKPYGHNSVYSLLQSMSDILCFPEMQSSQLDQQGMTPLMTNASVVTLGSIAAPTDFTNGGTKQGTSNIPNTSTITTTSSTLNANNAAKSSRKTFAPNTGMESVGTNAAAAMYINSSGGVMPSIPGITMHGFTSVPTYQQYQPIQLINNTIPLTMPQMPMYPGHILPQASDPEQSKPSWTTLDNMWPMQSIPTQQQPQQPIFLPSLSNLGAFSNRSLESMSGGKHQDNITHVPLLSQLSNGSQFGIQTKSSG